MRSAVAALLCFCALACSRAQESAQPPKTSAARSLLIITIDTLRADRVGAYGYTAARTPTIDRLARDGMKFDRAYATAPITLTSHASLMTGRYPAGHGARHNGVRLDPKVTTIADMLQGAGFTTGAFVGAFPLDKRFGLNKGFQTYDDRMPRGADGRIVNERPGRIVADEAIAWLDRNRDNPFFLWVHFFEPHAPYGDPRDRRPASVRYDDEVAEADTQAGRVLGALGAARDSTLIVLAADHGEAFGEHGEIGHSLFLYDTTLRVPLIVSGPGLRRGQTFAVSMSLADVAPTVMQILGVRGLDTDGVGLQRMLDPDVDVSPRERDLYAETFAPLLDFGWSPLKSVRSAGLKFIDAPKPELYDLEKDPRETKSLYAANLPRISELQNLVRKFAGSGVTAGAADDESRPRLQALGYASGSRAAGTGARPDPKDRRELAAAIAQVTSGELEGPALEAALGRILKDDPTNPQAHVRLGYVLADTRRCADAIPHFRAAIAEHLPSADAHLGLARCDAAAGRLDAAAATLREAERVEPDNPVAIANLGIVLSDGGHPKEAVEPLRRALALDPDLHQARFTLAIALARTGQRADAAATAEELLRRLPANAPRRGEVERLIRELR